MSANDYTPESDEERDFLASYDPTKFPAVGVTVDIVLLTVRQGRLSVLLVQRGGYPYKGMWALPGGFKNPDETLDQAAARELMEETGVTELEGHLEQLKTYGDPGRDPRMPVVSVAYVGMMPEASIPSLAAGSDASAARFWPVGDVLGGTEGDQPPLAFDHEDILRDGLERVRAKFEYTTLATSFVEEPFTVADLRRVYEEVWGVELEPRNFRRKVLKTDGFVTPTGDTVNVGRGKPVELYRRGGGATLHPPMLRPDPEGS